MRLGNSCISVGLSDEEGGSGVPLDPNESRDSTDAGVLGCTSDGAEGAGIFVLGGGGNGTDSEGGIFVLGGGGNDTDSVGVSDEEGGSSVSLDPNESRDSTDAGVPGCTSDGAEGAGIFVLGGGGGGTDPVGLSDEEGGSSVSLDPNESRDSTDAGVLGRTSDGGEGAGIFVLGGGGNGTDSEGGIFVLGGGGGGTDSEGGIFVLGGGGGGTDSEGDIFVLGGGGGGTDPEGGIFVLGGGGNGTDGGGLVGCLRDTSLFENALLSLGIRTACTNSNVRFLLTGWLSSVLSV